METAHLASMGAKPIPRHDFIREMKRLLELEPVPSPWRFEPSDVSY
jgi:Leu/Phe-tRNA-protein transferase